MALTIRLRQQGKNNHHTYRLVVIDKRMPRDGQYIEMVGWYDPRLPNEKNLVVHGERVDFWVKQGAVMSDSVKALVSKGAPEVTQGITARAVVKKQRLA